MVILALASADKRSLPVQDRTWNLNEGSVSTKLRTAESENCSRAGESGVQPSWRVGGAAELASWECSRAGELGVFTEESRTSDLIVII